LNVLLFLNELSVAPLAADVAAGRARMATFLGTVSRTRQVIKSARPVLHMTDAIDSVELAPGYPIASWRRDASRDERLRLLQLETQTPPLARDKAPLEIVERYLELDCRYEGQPALGLRGALAAKSLSVSLASAPCWNATMLTVEVEEIDGNEVTRRKDNVLHACAERHIDEHREWLVELERLTVRDGNDLWDRRSELFPALDFCKEVRGQLTCFLGGDVELRQVFKRLADLQKFFETWDATPIRPGSLPTKCTPESESTLGKYAREHTFSPPVGPPRVFSWHLRFTPGVGRIFFTGDVERKKGLVGYIGKDGLPTVNDPT
jgi:hypothetical protein